jgi:hypothetical protein
VWAGAGRLNECHSSDTGVMADLVVLEVVATEPEAELLRSLLRDAGIPCIANDQHGRGHR